MTALHTSTRTRLAVVVIVLAIVVAGALLATLASGSGAPSHPALDGVSDQDLADYGIQLMETDDQPLIDAKTAEEQAKAGVPDANPQVRQTALVRVINDRTDPPIDALAWAVNFDPATIQAIPPLGPGQYRFCGAHPLYSVVFIDADSGGLLFGAQRSMLDESESSDACPTTPPDGVKPTPAHGS